MAYSEAIAHGLAEINQCPPGGAEGVARLAAITGHPVLPLNPTNGLEAPRSVAVIDEDWCIGCGLCAKSCPYGNINMQPVPGQAGAAATRKATSCDLCTEHEEPSCVYACPHDAAHRVEPNQFFQWVATGERR